MKITAADLQAMGYNPDGSRIQRATTPTPSDAVDREADLHAAILDHCRAKGWPVVHSRMDAPTSCGVGTPDFVVAIPGGRTLWVEAKAKTGKLRPEQEAWLALLRHHGHRCGVVRSFSEFVALLTPDTTNA